MRSSPPPGWRDEIAGQNDSDPLDRLEHVFAPATLAPGERIIVVDLGPGSVWGLLRHGGVSPRDIGLILLTHLHMDHCENDYKCVNAQVFVQKKEIEFLNDPHPVDHRYYPDVLEGVNVTELDGDANIVDGIDVIYSPGHSPGGQSVLVNTAAGRVIITGFCCNDKNFPKTGPAIPPGVHIDLIEAYDSIQKIREMGDTILPLHDLSIGKRKSIP